MKKPCLVLLILLITGTLLQAQSQKATVYFLRAAGPDLNVPYYTYMDSTLLCRLGNGSYSFHKVEPGEHSFHAQYRGKIRSTPETKLLLELEPGKTYFISINLATKAFGKGRFYCEQLTDEEGRKRAETYYYDKNCL